jgi:hypothetical protein
VSLGATSLPDTVSSNRGEVCMAAKKPSMMKRDRERARDEKAARKREDRARSKERGAGDTGPRVATREELDGYGLPREASGDPFEDRNRG